MPGPPENAAEWADTASLSVCTNYPDIPSASSPACPCRGSALSLTPQAVDAIGAVAG